MLKKASFPRKQPKSKELRKMSNIGESGYQHKHPRHLVSSTETEDQVKGTFLLDIVVAQGTTILKLLTSKDKTLLIRGNSFLVLNLGLHIVNRVRGLDIQGDRLTSQSLDKDLHSSTRTKDQVKSGLLLNVVVTQCASVLKLLSSKDKTLLIRGDSFLVLDLGLDVVNGVRWFDIQSDSLSSKGLDENLQKRCEE